MQDTTSCSDINVDPSDRNEALDNREKALTESTTTIPATFAPKHHYHATTATWHNNHNNTTSIQHNNETIQTMDSTLIMESTTSSVRQRLIEFYTIHNPTKLNSIDSTLLKYHGREDALFAMLYAKYGIISNENDDDNTTLPNTGPIVFMEFALNSGIRGAEHMGMVKMMLFAEDTPATAENFRCLCTGEQHLSYLHSFIHRIVPNMCIQGGDITTGDGTGGKSIYAPNSTFPIQTDLWGNFIDETPFLHHSVAGLLSMANNGPNRNNSQFFITLKPCPHLNGKHVVFGKVIDGMDIVQRIAQTHGTTTTTRIQIVDCGQIRTNPDTGQEIWIRASESGGGSSGGREQQDKKGNHNDSNFLLNPNAKTKESTDFSWPTKSNSMGTTRSTVSVPCDNDGNSVPAVVDVVPADQAINDSTSQSPASTPFTSVQMPTADDVVEKEKASIAEVVNGRLDKDSCLEHRNYVNNNHDTINGQKNINVGVCKTRAALSLLTPSSSVAVSMAAAAAASVGFINERRLQTKLTSPPLLYGQCIDRGKNGISTTDTTLDGPVTDIVRRMRRQSAQHKMHPNEQGYTTPSVLERPLRPQLFVSTRSTIASVHAYLANGPQPTDTHLRFTENVIMPRDGALIALDWELPSMENFVLSTNLNQASRSVAAATQNPLEFDGLTTLQRQQKQQVLYGDIAQPVVLVLHGINNHAGYGYIRSMMRECCNRGWIAVGMNFRGCGTVSLRTPRQYNGAYTGDIRSVVHVLSHRLQKHQQPLFIVGNSLGANLLVKYLGEEGQSDTLPDCVAGAVTTANPMVIDARNMKSMMSAVMALGTKEYLWNTSNILRPMTSSIPPSSNHFRQCIQNAWKAVTLADYDAASAPIFCRNETTYPFAYKVGYESAQGYWKEASSFRYARMVSVPLLQLVARDDYLAHGPFFRTMAYSMANPNIIVLETMSGGHLGWQEEVMEKGRNGKTTLRNNQWADTALAEFFCAVLESRQSRISTTVQSKIPKDTPNHADNVSGQPHISEINRLRSRL